MVELLQVLSVEDMDDITRANFYENYDDGEDYLSFFPEDLDEEDQFLVDWFISQGCDTTKEILIRL